MADHLIHPDAAPISLGDGPHGVLLVHGFTGNPSSLRPLALDLHAAGLAVEVPRLPGHGTHWRHLRGTGWRDWVAGTLGALDRLRARTEHQAVVGLSMGGTLALDLAAHRDDIAALVLVNPSIRARGLGPRVVPLLRHVVPFAPGLGNDIARGGADEHPYPVAALDAAASLLDLQARVRSRLGDVRCPTLVFTSRVDHVVDPGESGTILQGIGSEDRRQVWLEDSFHVATLDNDAATITRESLAFLDRVLRPGG